MRRVLVFAIVALVIPGVASAGFITLEPTAPTVLQAPGTVAFDVFYFAEAGDNDLQAVNLRMNSAADNLTPDLDLLTVASGNNTGNPFDRPTFLMSDPPNPFILPVIDIGGIQDEPILPISAEGGIMIGELFIELTELGVFELLRVPFQTGARDINFELIPNTTPSLLATMTLLPEPAAVLLLLLGAVGFRQRIRNDRGMAQPAQRFRTALPVRDSRAQQSSCTLFRIPGARFQMPDESRIRYLAC